MNRDSKEQERKAGATNIIYIAEANVVPSDQTNPQAFTTEETKGQRSCHEPPVDFTCALPPQIFTFACASHHPTRV